VIATGVPGVDDPRISVCGGMMEAKEAIELLENVTDGFVSTDEHPTINALVMGIAAIERLETLKLWAEAWERRLVISHIGGGGIPYNPGPTWIQVLAVLNGEMTMPPEDS
jgi:hypothetical protein